MQKKISRLLILMLAVVMAACVMVSCGVADKTTDVSTATPTADATSTATGTPTGNPTDVPTDVPTEAPTDAPTATPTGAATGTPTPTVAPTATPKPTATPTPKPTATPKPTTSSSGKIVATYIYSNYNGLKQSDVENVDIIYAAFGLIDQETYTMTFRKADNKMKVLTDARKKDPDTKIVLSIGGWGADGFSQMAGSSTRRKTFIDSVMAFVDKYQLDGVDIDWEYPVTGGDIVHSDNDKNNFTKLLKDFREALDQRTASDGSKMLLTIAAAADYGYWQDSINVKQAIQYLDYVNLMTYDYNGAWSDTTGHHTNYSAPTSEWGWPGSSMVTSVKYALEAGVPAEKIIVGAAAYGKEFKGVTSKANNGLGQSYTGGCRDIDLSEIMDLVNNPNSGFKRYWDSKAQAPYLFDGSTFICYDDAESVKLKAEYVVKNNLAGIMFWEYDGDGDSIIITTSRNVFDGK